MNKLRKKYASRATRPPADRFWEKVRRGAPDECWEWTAYRAPDGYGRAMVDKVPRLAHRVSYLLSKGPIAAGMHILHSCDNRGCVNPAHLRQGTRFDNMRDMVKRGRANNAHARQTHCLRGHEFTPENTLVGSQGGGKSGGHRGCLTCLRAYRRQYHLAKKARREGRA